MARESILCGSGFQLRLLERKRFRNKDKVPCQTFLKELFLILKKRLAESKKLSRCI